MGIDDGLLLCKPVCDCCVKDCIAADLILADNSSFIMCLNFVLIRFFIIVCFFFFAFSSTHIKAKKMLLNCRRAA